MSITFAAALLAQAVSIVLLRHRLGGRWLRHPTTLLMLASCIDLGIAPLMLRIPSVAATNTYALGVNQGYTDLADFIMSITMLAFTVTYLLVRPELAVTGPPRQVDRAAMAKVLDWRIFAVACVPLVIITATGQGYNDGSVTASDVSLTTNIVTTFFIIVIAVASTGFLLRFGSRWFLPVLIVQSVLLAVAGERTPILMDALALILVLRFVGIPLRRRQLAVAAVLAVAGVSAITGVHSQQGRSIFYANSGVSGRVTALGQGLLGGSAIDEPAQPGLVAQFAIRESGVNFAGAVLQSISDGQPRLSAWYVPESFLLTVPSFLWSSKLDLGTGLDPAQQQINDFGLQNINFITGMVGEYTGYLTPPWLVILFGAFGFVFGRFERWLLRKSTPARAILLAGAVASALLYEAGLTAILVEMRAAVTLAILAKCAEMILGGRSSVQHSLRLARAHSSVAVHRGRHERVN